MLICASLCLVCFAFIPFWVSPPLHRRPDMVDMTRVSAQTNRSNLEQAFSVAEQLGVARLLDPEGEIYRRMLTR